jgi:hypothetical protein
VRKDWFVQSDCWTRNVKAKRASLGRKTGLANAGITKKMRDQARDEISDYLSRNPAVPRWTDD